MASAAELKNVVDFLWSEVKRVEKHGNERSDMVSRTTFTTGKQCHERINVELPNIKKIDNMKIFKVELIFYKQNRVVLRIYSDSIRAGFDDGEDCFGYEDDNAAKPLYTREYPLSENEWGKSVLRKYISLTLKSLSTLKFDRYNGKFAEEDRTNFRSLWKSLLNDVDTLETNSDECCVCNEETITNTTCCKKIMLLLLGQNKREI